MDTEALLNGWIDVLRHFCSNVFNFWLIFTCNPAMESYKHVDYAVLKNDGSSLEERLHRTFVSPL